MRLGPPILKSAGEPCRPRKRLDGPGKLDGLPGEPSCFMEGSSGAARPSQTHSGAGPPYDEADVVEHVDRGEIDVDGNSGRQAGIRPVAVWVCWAF